MDRFAQPTIADDRRAEALESCERAHASANIAIARVECIAACMRAMREFAATCRRESEAVASGYGISNEQLREIELQLADVVDDAAYHVNADINQEV